MVETNIGPNQLTRELVSPTVINTMINDIMLVKISDENGKTQTNKHGINNVVSIIIELIRKITPTMILIVGLIVLCYKMETGSNRSQFLCYVSMAQRF